MGDADHFATLTLHAPTSRNWTKSDIVTFGNDNATLRVNKVMSKLGKHHDDHTYM